MKSLSGREEFWILEEIHKDGTCLMTKGQLYLWLFCPLLWLVADSLWAAELEEETSVTSETQTESFSEAWNSLKGQLKKLKLNLMRAEKNLATSKTLLRDSEAHSTNLELQLQEASTTSTRLNDQLNLSNTILKEQESSINKLQNELVIWGAIGIVIGVTVGILLE
jgi:septal ring factor EnvC (AmiA/AmiB activator)